MDDDDVETRAEPDTGANAGQRRDRWQVSSVRRGTPLIVRPITEKLAPVTTTHYVACPTEIVEAPVGVVWKLLTNISGWGSFFNVRVTSVEPPGPAAKGQRMLGESGPRWLHLGLSFEYTFIDETHYKLELDARFPLGMTVHEALDCVPLEDGRCRVNYHCHFGFPGGWRGRLMRVLLSRRLKAGPADSLWRLKRAAEQAHRGRTAE